MHADWRKEQTNLAGAEESFGLRLLLLLLLLLSELFEIVVVFCADLMDNIGEEFLDLLGLGCSNDNSHALSNGHVD